MRPGPAMLRRNKTVGGTCARGVYVATLRIRSRRPGIPANATFRPVAASQLRIDPTSLTMSRPLLALCLFLFAASALAIEPAAPDDDAVATKPGKSTEVTTTPDPDAPVTHPVATPARTATRHPPRWHSLLPGMIR